MEGHKVAAGLFLVLVASGCIEMTSEASKASSFEDLGLSVEEVEAVTGADYRASESKLNHDRLNFSSAARKVETFFTRDSNLSEAPESVKSMVVALNGSEGGEEGVEQDFDEVVTIEGYQAKRLESEDEVVLYGEKNNLSYFVRAEGDEGIYSSTKELYLEIAKQADEFDRMPN